MAVRCAGDNKRYQATRITVCYPYTAVFCTGSYGSVYAVCCRQLLWSSPTYGTGPGPVYTVTVCTPYTVTVTIPTQYCARLDLIDTHLELDHMR